VLEITQPEGKIAAALLWIYLRGIAPFVARLIGRSPDTPMLYRYYWDTIAACVPPERVLATLVAAGFAGVRRRLGLGIFSEYCATAAGS
jgi:demethylmenaquinone methyltransferase/2-methoxy-6-polyprenyl-1,4-benzoquinol methylase